MEATFLPGRVDRSTEFVGGLTGACGPNAASMAERWADQSTLGTLDVYHRMRAAGRCDANGVSNLSGLVDDARSAGYRVDVLPYGEPMAEAMWRAFFAAHVGREAVVFETANGQALVDALTGRGENARNLHYHFVMVAGWHPGGHSDRAGRDLPPGWWCCDGDNFDVGDVLQFYPDGVLAASRPCGAMAVYPRVSMGGGAGGGHMGVPNGWSDDGHRLTSPNGGYAEQGMRDFILTYPGGWDPANTLMDHGEVYVDSVVPEDASWGPGSRLCTLRGYLGWLKTQSSHASAGEVHYFDTAGASLDHVLYAVVPGLQQQIAQLQQQLAAAQSQPPAQQPPAPDPFAEACKTVVRELAAAIALAG